MSNPALILLAAGSSSRMGQSKQLLKIKGTPLLVHSTTIALASAMKPIVVVVGAGAQAHRNVIKHLPVNIIVNKNWESGMGSSIKTGLNYLLKHNPALEAVIIMVCDQPQLTPGHLKKLKTKFTNSLRPIVASHYSGTAGVPALFNKSIFSEILNLPDDQGAKKIIQQHLEEVATVDFPDGVIDLDTLEDYQNFSN